MLELLKNLPTILSTFLEFIKLAQKQFGNDWIQFIADAGKTFKELNKAESTADRKLAAKTLQDILQKINVLLVCFLLSACGSKLPMKSDISKLTVCISDPSAAGFQCELPDRSQKFLPYEESKNFIAFSAEDSFEVFARLIECRANCSNPIAQ